MVTGGSRGGEIDGRRIREDDFQLIPTPRGANFLASLYLLPSSPPAFNEEENGGVGVYSVSVRTPELCMRYSCVCNHLWFVSKLYSVCVVLSVQERRHFVVCLSVLVIRCFCRMGFVCSMC